MTHPLPKYEQQNWRGLASVQVGGAVCLPLLLVGYELAKQGNPINMLLSILWGNLFLFGLALIAGYMSTKRNLTTVEHASLYFGSKGKSFFALTLSLSMLGWFAIQTQCMGGDLLHFVRHFHESTTAQLDIWKTCLSFVLAAFMVVGAFWGLQFLTWMSHVCVPLLLGTIGYAVYKIGALSWIETLSIHDIHLNIWDGKGISLVMASSMAATVDLPSFYRHANSRKAPIAASIVNYLIAMPLIQIAGMCLHYGTHASSMSEALAAQSSFGWKIWVLCFMLLAGWTTNNINLYSAALSLKSLDKKMTFPTAMGTAGIMGCFLVFMPLLEKFSLALDLMGIFVVAMGGVMFMAYLLENYTPVNSFSVWSAWCMGIGAGLSTFILPQWGWGSGAPVLDAGIVAMLTLVLLRLLDLIFKASLQDLNNEAVDKALDIQEFNYIFIEGEIK